MWADMRSPLAPWCLLGLVVIAAWFVLLAVPSVGAAAEQGMLVETETAGEQAQTKIPIEAEAYARSYVHYGGSLDFVHTLYASGGYAVIGLDYPGDWMEWDVTVPAPMVFRDSIRSAGESGIRRGYMVTFTPRDAGPSPVSDTLITQIGRGWG